MNQLELTNEQYKQKYLKYKKKYLDLKEELDGGASGPDVYNAMVKYIKKISVNNFTIKFNKEIYTYKKENKEQYTDPRINCDNRKEPFCTNACEWKSYVCQKKITGIKNIYTYKNNDDEELKLIHVLTNEEFSRFVEVEVNGKKHRIANNFFNGHTSSKRSYIKFSYNKKYYPLRCSMCNESLYTLLK
jgi:hypothetical protein